MSQDQIRRQDRIENRENDHNSDPGHPEVSDPNEVLPAPELLTQRVLDQIDLMTLNAPLIDKVVPDRAWRSVSTDTGPFDDHYVEVTRYFNRGEDYGNILAGILYRLEGDRQSRALEIWRDKNGSLRFTNEIVSASAEGNLENQVGLSDVTVSEANRLILALNQRSFHPG
ncbi:hypothetical protein [Streptomyces violascens]|uniref:hypothetical protein n=1 Tax=Streptomyces violascens TaxID=67381 RepID=UPI0036460D56